MAAPRIPLNDIRFEKTNGGLGRTNGKRDDAISALLFSCSIEMFNDLFEDASHSHPGNYGFDILDEATMAIRLDSADELPEVGIEWTKPGEGTGHDRALSSIETAANTLHYHVAEFFRLNGGAGPLYVGISKEDSIVNESSIVKLQQYAAGSIRQMGVILHNIPSIREIADQCKNLEDGHMPLSVIETDPKTNQSVSTAINTLAAHAAITHTHKCNISVLVGRDMDADLAAGLTDEHGNTTASLGCIGACVGAISKARVHESIAWVGQFPLGLNEPGVCDTALRNITTEELEELNGCRAIFVRTHVGISDNYFNDSHTLAPETSDYAYIENVRTIDKACRGVRSKLLPYLNGPLSVDASTGKLSADTVALLETVAGEALEDMEKAGELSGFRAEIDPDQNVLATSEVEVVIKNVPKGVMRKVNVKIGFTTQV